MCNMDILKFFVTFHYFVPIGDRNYWFLVYNVMYYTFLRFITTRAINVSKKKYDFNGFCSECLKRSIKKKHQQQEK